jgi:serine phosphatase RsbU (regulator of sigma subunit)
VKEATEEAERINSASGKAIAQFLKALAVDETINRDSSLTYYLAALDPLKSTGNYLELCEAYTYIGNVYLESGHYLKAVQSFQQAAEIAAVLKEHTLECRALTYGGMSYVQMGKRPEGIVLLQKAMGIAEKYDEKKYLSRICIFIGSAYSEGPSQDFAMQYFERGQKLAEQVQDTILLTEADMYIGNNHYYNKRYQQAIDLYEEVKVIAKKEGDNRLYAGALGNIGNCYTDMHEYDKALKCQFEAVPIFQAEGDNEGLTICYSDIGKIYFEKKDFKNSLLYYNRSLEIAKNMNSLEDLMSIHQGFYQTYEGMKDYKAAFEHFKEYKRLNDSIFSEGNTKRITEMELQYRYDAQQKEQQLIQKNKEQLADERLKRQKLYSYASITGALLLLLLVGIVWRGSRQRKRANIQLQEYNDEVIHQKEVIEHKNKEITDSINYAKRIQESILPLKTEIQETFPQSFVLFKPRDVVSGDFYWCDVKNNKKVVACVDCTGHGVPGAFMSMIGNTLLNEIINEKGITTPSEILTLLHERVRQSLKQDKNSETRDGMDISVCVINDKNTTLEYAGANRSVYIVRNGKLEELKADKQSIGGDQAEENRIFSNNEFVLQAGDTIYMSTDGYADQFGGEKGKKFMVKRYQEMLLEMQHLTMDEQGQLAKRIIEKWQGKIEQVDDILVIGIRV